MADTYDYGWVLLLIAAVGVAAVLSNRLTARLRVPVPLVLLAAAAAAVQLIPDLQAPPVRTVDRLVTVALVFILFNGGMHIGWPRFKTAAGPIGVVGGILGGRALLWFMRVPLPGEGLYPLRTLVSALALFGVATLAHGSGFLAVFVAGIVIGDARAPYKREIEHFHSAVASLGEI